MEVPLYYQLAGILRELVQWGEFAESGRIPTEAELASQYGVSRITVRQALASLERDGLIAREVGRGTFVRPQRRKTAALKVEGSLDDLISIGLFTSVKVLDLRTVKATREQAGALHVAPGSALTRCARLRYWHATPYCHVVVDLPGEYGERLTTRDFEGSILRALEDRLHVRIRDAHQTVRASLAGARLARLLDTRIGAPVLAIDRLVRGEDGTPVERVTTHYRSDLFSFSVHLHRDQHGWNAHAARAH
jgi:GntR family transcriptional regulator